MILVEKELQDFQEATHIVDCYFTSRPAALRLQGMTSSSLSFLDASTRQFSHQLTSSSYASPPLPRAKSTSSSTSKNSTPTASAFSTAAPSPAWSTLVALWPSHQEACIPQGYRRTSTSRISILGARSGIHCAGKWCAINVSWSARRNDQFLWFYLVGKTLAYTTCKFTNMKDELVARGSHTKFVAIAWKDEKNITDELKPHGPEMKDSSRSLHLPPGA